MSAAPVLSSTNSTLCQRLAAVLCSENAALGVRPVRMSDRRDVDDVRIRRMNAHPPDLAAVGQADVRPRLSGVGRLVHAVAGGDVGAKARLAHSDVDRCPGSTQRPPRRRPTGLEEPSEMLGQLVPASSVFHTPPPVAPM